MEILNIYRRLRQLRQDPTEAEWQILGAYRAEIAGRMKRLPRVEAIPKAGASDEVATLIHFPTTGTFPSPLPVETQFLQHDVEAFTKLAELMAVLLQKPLSQCNTRGRALLIDWLQYEVRYAAGCTIRWKPPFRFAISGRQSEPAICGSVSPIDDPPTPTPPPSCRR